MKAKLTKEEHGKLASDFQKEYEVDGDGYKLKVEGGEDVTGLKTALEKERAENKEIREKFAASEKEKSDAIEKAKAAELAKAAKSGDVETVTKALNEQHEKEKAALQAELDKQKTGRLDAALDAAVTKTAAEISTTPAAMEAVLRSKLKAVEGEDGKISVTSAEGLALDVVTKNILADKSLSSIIKAPGGSGGGAAGNPKPGGAGENKPIDYRKQSNAEIAAAQKARVLADE